MATWPSSLPQEFPEEGFSLTLPDNLLRTTMDVGPAKVRRRTTSNVTKVQGSMLLSTTDLAAFQTFYITTLSYGVTQFTWVHPITGVACDMRFTEPPKYSPASGDYVDVQMSLEILV